MSGLKSRLSCNSPCSANSSRLSGSCQLIQNLVHSNKHLELIPIYCPRCVSSTNSRNNNPLSYSSSSQKLLFCSSWLFKIKKIHQNLLGCLYKILQLYTISEFAAYERHLTNFTDLFFTIKAKTAVHYAMGICWPKHIDASISWYPAAIKGYLKSAYHQLVDYYCRLYMHQLTIYNRTAGSASIYSLQGDQNTHSIPLHMTPHSSPSSIFI